MSHAKSIIKLEDTDYELVPVRYKSNTTSYLRKVDDECMSSIQKYDYKPLDGAKKKIRLLQIKSGAKDSPDIYCQLMEASYDNVFHIPTRPILSDELVPGNSSSQSPDEENDILTLREEFPNLDTNDKDLMQKLKLHKALEHCKIEYEALSWCWGKGNAEYAILITENKDSVETVYKLGVKKQLALALKYLRRPDQVRTMWIDAICIDQENPSERNHQVQMMSRIYTRSKEVCIWLGDSDESSHQAIEFIRTEIMELRNFDALSNDPQYTDKWKALMMLMQREWFSRRWVVQEIALANNATIHCGADSIPWKEFAVAVELFVEVETATHRLSEIMQKDEKFRHIPGWFEYVSELGASLLVQATGTVFRAQNSPLESIGNSIQSQMDNARKRLIKYQTIDPLERRSLLSLEYLVSTMFIFQASEPRDSIYAMLAISRDAAPFAGSSGSSQDHHDDKTRLIMTACESFLEEKPFIVDYRRPYADVCKDFIEFAIARKAKLDPAQALDILCRPWALEPRADGKALPARLRSAPQKARPMRKLKPVAGHPTEARAMDGRTVKKYWEDVTKKEEDPKWTKLKDRYFPIRRPHQGYVTDPPTSPSNFVAQTAEQPSQPLDGAYEKEQKLGLPSWIARASKAPFSLDYSPGIEIQKTGRANADPLVGQSQDGHRNYNAAQTQKMRPITFRRRPQMGHYSLYVQGFVLDEVERVLDASQGGNIPKTWLDLAGWKDYKTDPPGELWRTLVADRGRDNRNPSYYYARACRESVNKGGIASGRVDTAALINNERNSIIAEFCRRVHAVIWNRHLFRTKNGRLGLANQVRKGDKICILYGCTVPVILEQCEEAKTPEQQEREQEEDRVESLKKVVRKCERRCELFDRHSEKVFKGLSIAKKVEEKKKQGPEELERFKFEERVLMKEDLEKLREDRDKAMATSQSRVPGADADKGRASQDSIRRPKSRTHMNLFIYIVSAIEYLYGIIHVWKMRAQGKYTVDMAKEKAPELWFKFKGECYLHGMMDGEAIGERIYTEIPDQVFELR